MVNAQGHAGDKESIKVLKTNSGRDYNIVSIDGKIIYVADKRINLDVHDRHFINELRKMFVDCNRVVIDDTGAGGKIFKVKSSGKVYQFRRGKRDDDGISVFIDNQKVENQLRRDRTFVNFADVIRYLTTNHKK
jgi:hypothetical protein